MGINIRKPNIDLGKIKDKALIAERFSTLQDSMKLERNRRRKLIRTGIIAGNFLILFGVAAFILINRSASQTIRNSVAGGITQSATTQVSTLDQLSSAQISLTIARMAKLPETTAIRNQSDSDSILLSSAQSDAKSVSQPVIVTIGQKSKQDIKQYTVVAGDTVPSIAAKYGITSDSIRWSNGLASNAVNAGKVLDIPPVNGIVYTVKSGDTPASLASRFRSDASQIVTINDAEVNGLTVGEKIIIPNGQQSAPAQVSFSFAAVYGGNGYDYGYCTYYVASQVSVPTNWGNANTWDNYAALSGWTVSTSPKVGAIAQSDAGWLGHVALVEDVSEDGTMIKYSDMNGLAGWGRVGRSDWTSSTRFQHYIYH